MANGKSRVCLGPKGSGLNLLLPRKAGISDGIIWCHSMLRSLGGQRKPSCWNPSVILKSNGDLNNCLPIPIQGIIDPNMPNSVRRCIIA